MKTLSFFVALLSLSVAFAGHAQIVVDHSGGCYIGTKLLPVSLEANPFGRSVTQAENIGFPTLNIGAWGNTVAGHLCPLVVNGLPAASEQITISNNH